MSRAYVFWHGRDASVSESDYRDRLLSFHARLAEAAPGGFLGSRVLRYDSLPWLPDGTEAWEDWYFIHDTSVLDRLDEIAMSARLREPHDRVAKMAVKGTAGLYRLRFGDAKATPSHVYWVSKPAGESYDAFYDRVRALGENVLALWGRQMVLGPTPEFCIISSGSLDLPDAVHCLPVVALLPEGDRDDLR